MDFIWVAVLPCEPHPPYNSQLAEELGYDSIMTGDHITIPTQIASDYPYRAQAEAKGQNPRFLSNQWEMTIK